MDNSPFLYESDKDITWKIFRLNLNLYCKKKVCIKEDLSIGSVRSRAEHNAYVTL